MAVQQRILQQGDGLATLKELMLSIQNPSLINEANETYRKEIALTEAEQTKVDDARALIAQYDGLVADLSARENALAADKEAHEQQVSDDEAKLSAESDRLNQLSASLVERQAAQDAVAKQQSELQVRLDKEQADIDSGYQKAVDFANAADIANKAAQAKNEEEAIRLTNLESDLKAKAQKLKEQIASF